MAQTFDVSSSTGTSSIMTGAAMPISAFATAASPRSATFPRRRRRDDRLHRASPSCPASSTARCISASRAPTHKEDLQIGLARGGDGRRHLRLRDAEHRSADDDAREALADKVSARAPPHALRLRLLGRRHARERRATSPSWSACRAPPASRSSWAPRPASLLVEDDDGVARDPARARAAARPSTPRTSTACASGGPCASPGDPSSHPVWRDAEAALRCTQAPRRASPARPARASTSCTSRPPRRWTSSPTTRTSRPSR